MFTYLRKINSIIIKIFKIKKKSIEKKNEEKELGKSIAGIERAAVAAMQNDLLNNPSLRKEYGLESKRHLEKF